MMSLWTKGVRFLLFQLGLEITHHSAGCTPIEGIEMVDGSLGGEPGVGEYSEYMKSVALSAG